MKQEAHMDFVAMLRDHVMEEDIETFTHVQELAAQVRKLGIDIIHLKVLIQSYFAQMITKL